jgi:hypothetical protein
MFVQVTANGCFSCYFNGTLSPCHDWGICKLCVCTMMSDSEACADCFVKQLQHCKHQEKGDAADTLQDQVAKNLSNNPLPTVWLLQVSVPNIPVLMTARPW